MQSSPITAPPRRARRMPKRRRQSRSRRPARTKIFKRLTTVPSRGCVPQCDRGVQGIGDHALVSGLLAVPQPRAWGVDAAQTTLRRPSFGVRSIQTNSFHSARIDCPIVSGSHQHGRREERLWRHTTLSQPRSATTSLGTSCSASKGFSTKMTPHSSNWASSTPSPS